MATVDATATGSWRLAGTGAGFGVTTAGLGGWRLFGQGHATIDAGSLYDDPEPELPEPGGSVTPPDPPLPPTPPDYAPVPLRHVWQRLGAPSLDADGLDRNWMPTHEGNGEYARFQIVVEGVDITYYLGAATPEPEWTETEPFGWGPATIRLPQLTVFHQMPAWARNGANVTIRLTPVPGSALSSPVTVYEGIVTRVGDRQEGGVVTLECTGLLYSADLQLRKPSFNTTPLDIGTAIPRALNGVVSRRYQKMAAVTTGIRTSVAGGNEPLLTGWLANILATAVDGKKQWTVALENRRPVLKLKSTTSTDWTVRAGQAGVAVDLGSDAAEGVNCIYGSGVNPDGGRWRNAKYPNWKPDDTPPFPNWAPVRSIRVGHRDSDTDSGTGVSDYQRKAGMPVTGYFSAANAAETKRQQRRMGILPDGIPGPQTWAATFATGSNTGSLDGAFQAPLAVATEVEPRLYGPDGDDLGPNPDYDPDVLRVERVINYGQGVTRAEGARNARSVLARDSDPGLAGTVTFDRVDPEQMHRYQLRAGSNGVVRGHRGQDVRLHVAGVSKRGQTVTLTVDSKARDYPTLQAVLERDRQATDPARTARLRLLQGQVSTDRPEYDAESPAGRIPRHAVHGGLWNVLRIPMGDHGRVVRTEFRTTGPAQRFSVAVFGKAVTANQLAARVGNPLTASENPWDKDLGDLGLLQSYGWNKQPAGYWPGTYSNPDGESASPVTGRLVDDTSWDYTSERSPWLWVAVIAASPGLIEGRLYGAAS